MIEITIPKLVDGECSVLCPFLAKVSGESICVIGPAIDNDGLLLPGPSCPVPGTYVLAPKAQWEAAQGACAAFCKLSREFGIQTELAQLAHRALGEEVKDEQ
jgi:hypothetical protein